MSAPAAVLAAFITKATSFRTIVALTTSTAVTVMVSGPMAYQAMAARDQIAATPARTEVTRPAQLSATTRPTGSVSTITTPKRTTTSPPTSPLPTDGIVVSIDVNRATSRPLDGATLRGETYIGVGRTDARSARFWLDAPPTEPPTATDSAPPFDLIAASAPMDVSKLTPGPHRLDVELTLASGATQALTATFSVA